MPQDEIELIKRCKLGDTDSFGKLYQRYRSKSFIIALGMLGKQEDAMDAIQDAFIKAFKKIKQFHTERNFSSWYYSILINQCKDHLRKRKRKQREIPMENINLQNRLRVDNSYYSPELLAERKEMYIYLWQAVGKLEIKHRQIIILRDFQDMPYKDIAEILNVPLGTVMSRLHQARKKLREKMKKYLNKSKSI